MRLPFDADQGTYDSWHAWYMRKVRDRSDSFHFIDLNDMTVAFAAAREIRDEHPELEEALNTYAPEAVERAGLDGGIFNAMAWLGNEIGLHPEQAQEYIFKVLG
jgi:hypothetical protein